MKWIKSAGGPLICLEIRLLSSWCGVDGTFKLEKCTPAQRSDYDRACSIGDYTGLVGVGGDSALVLGDLPMATTVFEKNESEIYIVRAIYMEPDKDISEFAHGFDEYFLGTPIERLSLKTFSNRLGLFDSAFPGSDLNTEVLEFPLSPGHYEIKTVLMDPDPQTSLVVHQFRLSD